jgi:hypothetical protein
LGCRFPFPAQVGQESGIDRIPHSVVHRHDRRNTQLQKC